MADSANSPKAPTDAFQAGDWQVVPAEGVLRQGETEVHLTLQQMTLLEYLVAHRDRVVSKEEIFQSVWQGAEVEDVGLARCISEIRHVLGDDARRPRYIQTFPKRGYRWIAPLDPAPPSPQTRNARPRRAGLRVAAVLAAPVALGVYLLAVYGSPFADRQVPPTSVAVLGFTSLDHQPEGRWLSAALAEMLTTELALSANLTVVPRRAITRLQRELALTDALDSDDDAVERLQHALGVDLVVDGSYLVTPGQPPQIRIDVRVWDAAGSLGFEAFAETGAGDRLLDLVSNTGRRLRALLGAGEPPGGDGSTAADPSIELATRRYVEGLERLRHQDALAARELLTQSVEARPDNPLAHLALAEAWTLLGYERRADEVSDRALELAADSPREQQLWIEANVLERQRRWSEAMERYRALGIFSPQNLEYGLYLARTQNKAGKADEALATVRKIRARADGPSHDPRLDLVSSTAHAQLGDHEEALRAAGRAVTLGARLGAELVVAEGRHEQASALYALGQGVEALAALEEARASYARAGDRRQQARVQSTRSRWLTVNGDFAAAQELGRAALAVFREIGDRAGEAQQPDDLAWTISQTLEFDTPERMLREAIDLYRELANRAGEARAVRNLAILYARTNRHDGAKPHFERALALYEAIGNHDRVGVVLTDLGRLHMLRGEFATAEMRLEQADHILRGHGTERSYARLQLHLGMVHGVSGKLAEAQTALDGAVTTFRQVEDRLQLAHALLILAEVLIDRDDLTAARERIEEAVELTGQIGEPARLGHAQIVQVLVLLETGALTQAEALARDTVELVGSAEATTAVLARHVLAEARLALHRPNEAYDVILEARALLDGSQVPTTDLARHWLAVTEARVRAALGQHDAARRLLLDVLERAAQQGARVIHGEARLALAGLEIHRGENDTAAQRLAQLEADARGGGWHLLAKKARALARSLRDRQSG